MNETATEDSPDEDSPDEFDAMINEMAKNPGGRKKSPEIMKPNQEYIRKRRPNGFTSGDCDANIEDEDEEFECNYHPTTSKSLPKRDCKKNVVYSETGNFEGNQTNDEVENIEHTTNPKFSPEYWSGYIKWTKGNIKLSRY